MTDGESIRQKSLRRALWQAAEQQRPLRPHHTAAHVYPLENAQQRRNVTKQTDVICPNTVAELAQLLARPEPLTLFVAKADWELLPAPLKAARHKTVFVDCD